MIFYNEYAREPAQWIRELIKMGLVANGQVDEKSIIEVEANELAGYGRCHFFAGIAGWEYALQLAGVPNDFECWTGSCPCQSFSTADLHRVRLQSRGAGTGREAGQLSGPYLCCEDSGMGDTEHHGHDNGAVRRKTGTSEDKRRLLESERPSTPWDNPDWVYCRDGAWRPIGAGINPTVRTVKSAPIGLANGSSSGMVQSGDQGPCDIKNTQESRRMRLHGYGNAIVPRVAAGFIRTFLESLECL